ncbi:MAG: hypothetical protein BAJALOKI1v1_460011 [Promethearchaeota archaeon]|nr:MAG: hypothetical protein BAJALOKI1v1_460011 [Candidatus Lokiarchaeota archaeon]
MGTSVTDEVGNVCYASEVELRNDITGKIQGFRKFDKVRYEDGEYFIKGRMSSGYAVLIDITGKKKEFKPLLKLSNMM